SPRVWSGSRRRPDEVVTAPAPGATSSVVYAGDAPNARAVLNTSTGPVTSSDCTPGWATTTTRRAVGGGAMGAILGPAGRGSKDQVLAFPAIGSGGAPRSRHPAAGYRPVDRLEQAIIVREHPLPVWLID